MTERHAVAIWSLRSSSISVKTRAFSQSCHVIWEDINKNNMANTHLIYPTKLVVSEQIIRSKAGGCFLMTIDGSTVTNVRQTAAVKSDAGSPAMKIHGLYFRDLRAMIPSAII